MSAYTPELVRALVDDLDDVFRDAIRDKCLSKAFENEKGRMVSI